MLQSCWLLSRLYIFGLGLCLCSPTRKKGLVFIVNELNLFLSICDLYVICKSMCMVRFLTAIYSFLFFFFSFAWIWKIGAGTFILTCLMKKLEKCRGLNENKDV